MTLTVELTPSPNGWDITISRPDGEWSCKDISGRRAVQAVTAEVEAAIDHATASEAEERQLREIRHIDGDPRNNEPSNLRIETRPKSHGVGPKEAR